ncbi:hypothetical protein ANRL2_04603 [Anaerolineae bacterium]|nr:hypothetical protein ANRL2_04603 [Anaerolineae bacterium]
MADRKFDRLGRLHYTRNGRFVPDSETDVFKDGQNSVLQAVGKKTGQGFLTSVMRWLGWNDATRHEEPARDQLLENDRHKRTAG